ncbi:hypothetical protein BZL29_6992 [Mycobacterium kansasii]|uniref:Uncharacterized protein n=1 Tax=Mycobacterium kansasii TaxID=1768 RepID=A0A1V3WMV8_MYCKA|nr:hypothetical protein BZL29_6992 [Mycobacterium kansasii]
MLISFGASRNGVEVKEAIRRYGEWERISQSALPLHLGGAHFVTGQAAVELQIILDLERRGVDIGIAAASRPNSAVPSGTMFRRRKTTRLRLTFTPRPAAAPTEARHRIRSSRFIGGRSTRVDGCTCCTRWNGFSWTAAMQ